MITTANNIQNHALTFNIKRGRNSSVAIGSVSVATNIPTVANTITTDDNGDRTNTLDFGLISGAKGNNGTDGADGTDGKSSSDDIGTPTVTNTVTIDGNGNSLNTLSFGLVTGQQGQQGAKGDKGEQVEKGDKGDDGSNGDSTAATAAAAAVVVAAGAAATSASASATSASASSASAAAAEQLAEQAEARTLYIRAGGSYPAGYTTFNASNEAEVIRMYNNLTDLSPSLKIRNNGNIEQTSGSSSLKNTTVTSSLNIRNSATDNIEILLDANGTNEFKNETVFYGEIESRDKVITKDTTQTQKILLDPNLTNVISNPIEFNGNVIINGNISGSISSSIILQATNQQLGSSTQTQSTQILGAIIDIGTTANTTSMDLEATTLVLKSQDIRIGRDVTNQFIRIGNSTYIDQTDIEGVVINLGTGALFQTVNIGNSFSVVNIRTIPGNSIGFFTAIDQMNGTF